VILGTAALKDPALLQEALDTHGQERVMVSVDTRGGLATSSGWTETGTRAAAEVLASLVSVGVSRVVYTDVDRDGMLEGPDLARVRELAEPLRASMIYSGGIGALADLEGLAGLSLASLDGVIVGKALYERRFTVPEAMRALAG
jgi:phosphoribosylformimino-5-aminoimidazole carboxamide ribotide isomerase